jgi:hypothetical protein
VTGQQVIDYFNHESGQDFWNIRPVPAPPQPARLEIRFEMKAWPAG